MSFLLWWRSRLPLLFIVLVFLIPVLVTWSLFVLPAPILGENQTLKLTDRKGNELASIHFDKWGQYTPIEKMSPWLLEAAIATEDQDFLLHHGYDFDRIIGSLFSNIAQGEIVQGASTITQQVAKNLFLNQEQTWERKIEEFFLSLRLEAHYDKSTILEAYLNSAYFGHGLYGIENATQFFLHKSAYSISLAESALMIAIINSPGLFSPLIDYSRSISRQQEVLKRMFEQQRISLTEYEQARVEPLELFGSAIEDYSPFGYYKDAVMEELIRLGLWTREYQQLGLVVQTYLDATLQKEVVAIASSYDGLDEVQVASVLMRPYSGEVLALVGGFNYLTSPFNRALYAMRQTGSAIKPLLYYLALQNGMTPTSKFRSEETTFFIRDFGSYEPHNYQDTYANRDITMIEALAVSDNIYAVKTTLLFGSAALANLLNQFGIEAPSLPSIGLGVADISPLQLTSIYNTFASEGVYFKPRFIKKVETPTGKVLYQATNEGIKKLDSTTTLILNQMMKVPFSSTLESYTSPSLKGYQPSLPFGGKTGSTASDAWVLGYNPALTLGVWVGNDEGGEIHRTGLAKQIFLKIANTFSLTQKALWYSPSSFLEGRRIDPISGEDDMEGELFYFRR